MSRHTTHPEHKTLFQFIADAFFEREPILLARGNRGGGKTRGYSIFETATTVFKDHSFTVHVGGSEGQAKDGYAYYAGSKARDGEDGLIRKPYFANLLDEEPMVSRTVLTNGAKLEIRTGGSERAVSGPHPQILAVDEVDHIDPQTLATAMEMPMDGHGYKATTLLASSQYHSSGTMQSFIDTAEERNLPVYQFDIFDTMQPCGREYPSECGDCPLQYWVNPYTNNHEELCTGRGSRADGHYPYTNVVSKFVNAIDPEKWALQNLLLNDRQQGLVYPQYDSGNQQSFPPSGADLTKWTCFAGIDQRGRGRIVVLAQGPDEYSNGKKPTWAIAEWADDNNTPSKLIQAAKDMSRRIVEEFGLHISAFWSERAAADLIKDWPADMGCSIIPKEVANVAYGIGVVRDAFRDNTMTRSLFIDTERCPKLHRAIAKKYKCKRNADGSYNRDRPGKSGEDFADTLRYAYVGGAGRSYFHLPEPVILGPPRGAFGNQERHTQNKWRPY
jgi:hypothetical protein